MRRRHRANMHAPPPRRHALLRLTRVKQCLNPHLTVRRDVHVVCCLTMLGQVAVYEQIFVQKLNARKICALSTIMWYCTEARGREAARGPRAECNKCHTSRVHVI